MSDSRPELSVEEATEAIRDYIRRHQRIFANPGLHVAAGLKWPYPALLLAEHGRVFTPAPLPEHVPNGRPRSCFADAFALATNRKLPGYIYCEGYAISQDVPMPVHHAWCVAESEPSRVVDPTWHRFKTNAYVGIPFDLQFLRQLVARRQQYGAFEDREFLMNPAEAFLHPCHSSIPLLFSEPRMDQVRPSVVS